MRVLMLGGTGLTGPFAVRRLAALGHQVTAISPREAGAGQKLPPAERSADVVIHTWLMTEADAGAFVDAFRGRAARAVVISSGDVYRAYGRLTGKEPGPPDPVPLAEDAPLRESRYPYGGDYEKILVEQTCQGQSEMPVTILRYPAVYGPNDSYRFRSWLKPMLDGLSEIALPDTFAAWRWTHAYCEDVAEAVVLAAVNPRASGRTYNVGEAETPPWAERLERMAAAIGWTGRIRIRPVREFPEDQQFPPDPRQDLTMGTRRLREELGYREVVPADEGYRRTAAWAKAIK